MCVNKFLNNYSSESLKNSTEFVVGWRRLLNRHDVKVSSAAMKIQHFFCRNLIHEEKLDGLNLGKNPNFPIRNFCHRIMTRRQNK